MRTRGLEPVDAKVFGTYQIQGAGGRGVLASGPNLRGDNGWRSVELVFQGPADGRVRVAPFLAGFGKGRGTAWFDGLTLDEIEPGKSPVVITRDFLRPGRIEPGQYGQFIEYLCTLVPGMWAEKLRDGGFEGLSPYKFAYLKETDFREHPWYPTGSTNRARHRREASTKINGEVSLAITAQNGVACTLGVSQDGLAVEKGLGCAFSCYLKQEGLSGSGGGSPPSRRDASTPHPSFGRRANGVNIKLRSIPTSTDDRVTLSIECQGSGTLWLDAASLVPKDAVSGWRRDVVEAVRAMKPGVIRFGGSALDDPNLGEFDWRDTLGDPDRRRPFRAWGGLQPAGAGLEEIVQFCYLVGCRAPDLRSDQQANPRRGRRPDPVFQRIGRYADGQRFGPRTAIASRTRSVTGRWATSKEARRTKRVCRSFARR